MHRPKPDKCPESGTRTNTDYVPYGPEWESYCMRLTKDRIIKMWREVCIERDRLQKLRSPGNLAAMREALVAIVDYYQTTCRSRSHIASVLHTLVENARAALAAPARNCDVGTPAEQAERFHRYCRAHRTFFMVCSASCPFTSAPDINHCQSGWAQLPYEAAKEGGAL